MSNATRTPCLVVLISATVVSACGGGGDDDSGGGQGFLPITAATTAGFVAGSIAEATAGIVPAGTYNNTIVQGSGGGSATVTGTESFTGSQPCGTGCVTSSHSANLTITFNEYFTRPGIGASHFVRLTGTVTFMDNRSTTQSGSTFSSSGEQRVTATTSLGVRLVFDDGTSANGVADTLGALTAFGETGLPWRGTLRPSNGTTYTF